MCTDQTNRQTYFTNMCTDHTNRQTYFRCSVSPIPIVRPIISKHVLLTLSARPIISNKFQNDQLFDL